METIKLKTITKEDYAKAIKREFLTLKETDGNQYFSSVARELIEKNENDINTYSIFAFTKKEKELSSQSSSFWNEKYATLTKIEIYATLYDFFDENEEE